MKRRRRKIEREVRVENEGKIEKREKRDENTEVGVHATELLGL